jgi:adiponectin receptor
MASSPTTTTCCEACNCADGGDTAGKEEERKKKCDLIGYDDLPEWLKDNKFILGYYRCEWPMKETILSIFSIHNETLNVWS